MAGSASAGSSWAASAPEKSSRRPAQRRGTGGVSPVATITLALDAPRRVVECFDLHSARPRALGLAAGRHEMEIRQFRVVLKARDFDRTCSFYGETPGAAAAAELGPRERPRRALPGRHRGDRDPGPRPRRRRRARTKRSTTRARCTRWSSSSIVALGGEGLRGAHLPQPQHPGRPRRGRRRRHDLRHPRSRRRQDRLPPDRRGRATPARRPRSRICRLRRRFGTLPSPFGAFV